MKIDQGRAITLALLLIWWGVVEAIEALPRGVGLVGIGLILLGASAIRVLRGRSVHRCPTIIGASLLAVGALLLGHSLGILPFLVPPFPALLVAFGMSILLLQIPSLGSHHENPG